MSRASQAIIIKENHVLLVKQEEKGRIFWNFPGGKIEMNESPEQTCIREVAEETGYIVRITSLFCEIESGSHPGSEGHEYVFLAEIIGGIEKREEGILKLEWVSLDREDVWDEKTGPVMAKYKALEAEEAQRNGCG